MEAKVPQITLGEPICAKIKKLYYFNLTWVECYRDVAAKFTELKKIARRFYSGKEEIEILMELAKYSQKDISDAMESA